MKSNKRINTQSNKTVHSATRWWKKGKQNTRTLRTKKRRNAYPSLRKLVWSDIAGVQKGTQFRFMVQEQQTEQVVSSTVTSEKTRKKFPLNVTDRAFNREYAKKILIRKNSFKKILV